MQNNLIVNQKAVGELFQANWANFLIPDYQRPYAWGKDECETLWDDIFEFAFPGADRDRFNDDKDQYYLGPIVTFSHCPFMLISLDVCIFSEFSTDGQTSEGFRC